MKYFRYLVISTLARIPATLLCTMMGDSLQDGQWEFAISIIVITILGIKYIDGLLGNKKNGEE